MSDTHTRISWPDSEPPAHVSAESIANYFDGALSPADGAVVQEHITFCAECRTLAIACRVELASCTGFDPVTGERFQLDAEWDVSAIPVFAPMAVEEFARQAAARPGPGAQDFKKSGLNVTLALVNNQLKAVVTRGPQPIENAEVRLELRGEQYDSRDFELYAWGTTDGDGAANMGPFRPFHSFPNGHRFVLGIVLPET